jgi:hypothetical protein
MGFNQSSVSSKVSTSDLFGAVLAGFGIWKKPSLEAKPELARSAVAPSNIYPLRIVRVKEANPQMAGRMVISGRMADVCAELDRLAA